ncbi:hypothetical protein C8R43DRAFT_976837 [Mycena crocata]|nr:hypothetical protein C8R43DRAFT_976837 [Mycena crocata]
MYPSAHPPPLHRYQRHIHPAFTGHHYGQFKRTPYPSRGILMGSPPRSSMNAIAQHDPAHLPLQHVQPVHDSHPREQSNWHPNGIQVQLYGPQNFEYHSSSMNHYVRSYCPHPLSDYGLPQHSDQPHHREQHSQFQSGSQPQFCGHPTSPQRVTSMAQVLPPDREMTPTPQVPYPSHEWKKENKFDSRAIQTELALTWEDNSQCPKPSGKCIPPVPTYIVTNPDVKVGDAVIIRPRSNQFTWMAGHVVDVADSSAIIVIPSIQLIFHANVLSQNNKPSRRYMVSYRDPDSNHLVQRAFYPAKGDILVKETDEPGLQPLPDGVDRDIYACIPPLLRNSGTPIEMIWAHARCLTPPDENDEINIRILIGPSKNFLFDKFPVEYTLPFSQTSRSRVIELGYTVAGSNEHPIEDIKMKRI